MAVTSTSDKPSVGTASGQVSMAAVPCLPLQAAWLNESPAFQSPVANVVRAAFQMLDRAWRSIPAGTLPSQPAILAPMVGLTQTEMAQHFEVLTAGWELHDGRFVHEGLSDLARRIWVSQADALDHLASTAPVVIQAPEEFELVSQDSVAASPLKGKRRLPHDFGLTPELREWLRTTMFIEDAADQDFLMNKFLDYARNKNEKYSNPVAGFRLFASREDLRRLPSRQNGARNSVFERMTRFGNGGESATNRNRDVLRNVMGRRDQQPQPERDAP